MHILNLVLRNSNMVLRIVKLKMLIDRLISKPVIIKIKLLKPECKGNKSVLTLYVLLLVILLVRTAGYITKPFLVVKVPINCLV